jgi:chromate transporter
LTSQAEKESRVSLSTVAREWGRIGCIGFGGPPAHIALLRRLVVQDRGWLAAPEFEDGIAAVNLLPGPASTQLAIYSAWAVRGTPGAVVGALSFICPGLIVIIALAALFLSTHPPAAVTGLAAGAGAAVPAVAVAAAWTLVPPSWQRAGAARAARARWLAYALVGGAAAALVGPFLVLVLAGAGLLEVAVRVRPRPNGAALAFLPLATVPGVAWVAFKVGALSYGGGFVIVPLMQHDAVVAHHWMTGSQFLSAVALGQITPGPVVQTVAVVGYAAGGVGTAVVASVVAFAPSFFFVVLGGRFFGRLRADRRVQAFLTGAGPAAIGAIAGSAIPLGLELRHLWQVAVLAGALVWTLALRRSVVLALLGSALVGLVVTVA